MSKHKEAKQFDLKFNLKAGQINRFIWLFAAIAPNHAFNQINQFAECMLSVGQAVNW